MAKKGKKKKKEPPPPPAPESEVELVPAGPKDELPEPMLLHHGTITRMGKWSVAESKQHFVVLLHDGGTTVMLPLSYAGVVFVRERPSPETVALQRKLADAEAAKKAKEGPKTPFEEIKALDAEIKATEDEIAAIPEGVKLTADGGRTEGPDGLPTAAECRFAVAGAPPPPPKPGWFKAADYMFRFSSPTAPPDPDAAPEAPPVRSADKTAVVEIVPIAESTTGSPFQLTLSAGGGCVATVRTDGEPHVLAPGPPADLRNLVPLPDIGGGTWQVRALVRFQGWELLRSMLCAKVSDRVSLAVREALAQEAQAGAAENPWAACRCLVHLLVSMEAPQEVVRSVVAVGAAALVETPAVNRYVRELRSPCAVRSAPDIPGWCIATVKDGVEPVHMRRQNLTFYHEVSGLYVALPPVSAGEFFMHAGKGAAVDDSFINGGFAVSHATAIDAEGNQEPADSAATMLFCRFRKAVCRDSLPVGRYIFGPWMIIAQPTQFTCLEVKSLHPAAPAFSIKLSLEGTATFNSATNRGFRLQ